LTEESFAVIAKILPEPVALINSDGEILFANQHFEKFFRANGESLSGKNLFDLTITQPDKLAAFLQNCSRSRQMLIGALRLRGENGENSLCQCQGALLEPAGDNKAAKIFLRLKPEESSSRQFALLTEKIDALNKEILERRRAEEKNETLYREAVEASRLKDEFLATLSHELRTPLNAVLGWARMLRTNSLDEAAFHRALETIERNARSQSQLIEDLLDVSRIITGKLRLDARPVEIASIIELAVDSVKPSADNKSIRLQTILDPRAGFISGDAERLQQAVWNLLSNAIKFTPKRGRIQIRLERVNSHVEIIVSDTGKGISKEFLPFVFERFLQADASKSSKYGGLGLGLAITRHIVELHGGTVHAHSAGEEKGATFTIKLPLLIIREDKRFPEEAGIRRHPTAEETTAYDCLPPIENLRLLVVDDNEDARDLLKTILEKCEAEVATAAFADEAFEILSRGEFDILISDIEMPNQDGYSLITKIRESEDEKIRLIPAIALTAHARTEDRLRIISAGFDSHIAKPFEPAELIAVIAGLASRVKG
jgi:signal transduction histidine kinase/CheY-like chemotaxis protein